MLPGLRAIVQRGVGLDSGKTSCVRCRSGVTSVTVEYGGAWTTEKLACVEKYMRAYRIALKNQPFRLEYVDAFAGSGESPPPARRVSPGDPLFALEMTESEQIRAGSARLALQVEPPFDSYLFIDTRAGKVRQLEKMVNDFPDRKARCRVVHGDANEVLSRYCDQNWAGRRTLVFLDPFDTAVRWPTLQALGSTRAIDLVVSLPVVWRLEDGDRVTRHSGLGPHDSTRFSALPSGATSSTDLLAQMPLFGDTSTQVERMVSTERLRQFVMGRVQTAFHPVTADSRILYNSKISPLFLLVFAAAERERRPARDEDRQAHH